MLMQDDPSTLGALIASLLVFAALAWLVMGLPMRMAAAASKQLMLGNLLLAASSYLNFVSNDLGLAWQWATLLLPLVGMCYLRNGLQKIARQRSSLQESIWLCLGVAALLLSLSLAGGTLWASSIVCLFAMSWITARCFLDCLHGARGAFGDGLAVITASPFAVLAGLLLFRALSLLIGSADDPLPTSINANEAETVRWLLLVLLFSINLSVVGLVLNRFLARLGVLANRDGLTGLLNRRAIMASIANENDRGRRTGQPFAVVMLDLDRFKVLNDRLGHAGGDAALKHAGKVVAASLRTLDTLGRFGGEEFLIVLPMTDITGAKISAERMRASLAEAPLMWHGHAVPITASFGVSISDPADDRIERVVQRADEAMYRAKQGGRNRVEVAMPEAPTPTSGAPGQMNGPGLPSAGNSLATQR